MAKPKQNEVIAETPKKQKKAGKKRDETPPSPETTPVSPPAKQSKFSADDFKVIARVVYNEPEPSSRLVNEIKNLFTWLRIYQMSDLETTAKPEDILATITIPASWELGGMHKCRFNEFLEYASVRGTTLPPDLTRDRVKDVLDTRNKESARSVAGSALSDPDANSSLKYSLKTVPKYNGDDTEFWGWSDSVRSIFGLATIEGSLDDTDFYLNDPKASTAGFYALGQALKGGSLAYLPNKVKAAKGRTVVYDLWSALLKIFMTPENESHFMMYSFGKLMDLRLDTATTVKDFIGEWMEITERMKQFSEHGGTQVFQNRELQRTFLLHCIRHEDFKETRRYIIKNPEKPISDYLKELRATNSSNRQMNDESPTNDEGGAIISTRRGVSFPQEKHPYAEKQEGGSKFKKWHIPPLPEGLRNVIPLGLYKRLENWRNAANGTTTSPFSLNRKFGVQRGREIVDNNPRARKKARRAEVSDNEESVEEESGSPSGSKVYQILSSHKRLRRGKDGKQVAAYDQVSQMKL